MTPEIEVRTACTLRKLPKETQAQTRCKNTRHTKTCTHQGGIECVVNTHPFALRDTPPVGVVLAERHKHILQRATLKCACLLADDGCLHDLLRWWL